MRLNPESAAHAAFSRRLEPDAAAPIAVGVSGGGDSLALLILTLEWAKPRGRRVIALTVDHGLQAESPAWTATAQAAARRLGADTRTLTWNGAKPTTGLPAAARDARHRLLADAARAAGARVLLLGHTADDLTEAAVMRAEGSSVGDPREWAPSPVWPEGREVFLLRPLLEVSRSDLRRFLRARGEAWLDDPANEDVTYARARARQAASVPSAGLAGPRPTQAGEEKFAASPPLPLSESGVTEGVLLTLSRADLTASLLAAACLCAAGHDRPPRRREVEALAVRLARPGAVRATLAGARIEADDETVRFAREVGRAGLPVLALPPGEPTIWDGRFEIVADKSGLTVQALKGLAAQLPAAERAALRTIPAFARPALPVVVDPSGAVTCPTLAGPMLAGVSAVRIAPLVLKRFAAACGQVTREDEGDERARGEMQRGVLSWASVV